MKHFKRALLGMALAIISVSAWAQEIIANGTEKRMIEINKRKQSEL